MGTGRYNKYFGGFEPDEPKMKTVETLANKKRGEKADEQDYAET